MAYNVPAVGDGFAEPEPPKGGEAHTDLLGEVLFHFIAFVLPIDNIYFVFLFGSSSSFICTTICI